MMAEIAEVNRRWKFAVQTGFDFVCHIFPCSNAMSRKMAYPARSR